LYVAVIRCGPGVRLFVEKLAVPLPLDGVSVCAGLWGVPSTKNVTVPVGTVAPAFCGVTVAVNVTCWPNAEVPVGALDESVVVVFALITLIVAEPVLLAAPLSVAVSGPVVSVWLPTWVDLTVTVIEQVLPAVIVPPASLRLVSFGESAPPVPFVVLPPHVDRRPVGLAMTIFDGRSVANVMPVRPIEFGFVISNLRVPVPPKLSVVGLRLTAIVGAEATVSCVVAGVPVPPFADVGASDVTV